MEFIIKLARSHSSLFVMIFASGSIFFSNILLKQFLSSNQYFEYSLSITIFSLLTSFGALGFEQVFLRLSVINDKEISFDWKILILTIISSISASSVSAFYLNGNLNSTYPLLFFLSLGIITLMLLYNTFRIVSYFLVSQLISNSWKFILLFFTLAIFMGYNIFSSFLICITVIVWMIIICSIFISKRFIKINLNSEYSFRYVFLFGLIFFISLLSISFLSLGDRLIIESYFNKGDFNNYFYLGSIYLFPFSLLQSYVGFKELVKFKTIKVNLKNSVNRLMIYSFLLTLLLLIASFFLTELGFLEINFKKDIVLILALITIGNIKMPYSLYSSIIGVRSSFTEIKFMNFYFIGISILIIFTIKFFYWNIKIIPILFAFLWIVRLIIWKIYSKKINYEIEV